MLMLNPAAYVRYSVHPKSYFFLSTTQAKALQYVMDIPLKASYIPSHISSFPQPKQRKLWPGPEYPENNENKYKKLNK